MVAQPAVLQLVEILGAGDERSRLDRRCGVDLRRELRRPKYASTTPARRLPTCNQPEDTLGDGLGHATSLCAPLDGPAGRFDRGVTIPAPVPSSQSLVRLEAVRKSFGDNLVLDGIDLDVETGEVLTIIGLERERQVDPAALREPARARRFGPDLPRGRGDHEARADSSAIRQRIGIVFQQFNLFPHLKVIDNLDFCVAADPEGAARAGGDARTGAARARWLEEGAAVPTSSGGSSSGSRSRGR